MHLHTELNRINSILMAELKSFRIKITLQIRHFFSMSLLFNQENTTTRFYKNISHVSVCDFMLIQE